MKLKIRLIDGSESDHGIKYIFVLEMVLAQFHNDFLFQHKKSSLTNLRRQFEKSYLQEPEIAFPTQYWSYLFVLMKFQQFLIDFM